MNNPIKVAVFGSAIVAPESDEYQSAYVVGQALAQAGYTVMTGGYAGIMAGASHGAAEAGGHVIGVTSTRIEILRNGLDANGWVHEKIHHETLRERLVYLVQQADAYVIMPGGLGTLTELALAWELVRAGELPPRPIIVYGTYWRQIIAPLQESAYIHAGAFDAMYFVDDAAGVLNALTRDVPDTSAMGSSVQG